MTKTILLTGATDGIGLETAKILATQGHKLLIHGRSADKLAATQALLSKLDSSSDIESYRADLSNLADVEQLADAVAARHSKLDVLINNAGVFKLPGSPTVGGLDTRFLVNTIAPYVLTRRLLPLMTAQGRVINLSSAAQASVDFGALVGRKQLTDSDAYAQSKLAITMWSFHLAQSIADDGPAIIAVNPASFLGSKMVKQAYGSDGKDLGIGADILVRAATSSEFADATGRYFDNDSGQFAQPHRDALNPSKNEELVSIIDNIVGKVVVDISETS